MEVWINYKQHLYNTHIYYQVMPSVTPERGVVSSYVRNLFNHNVKEDLSVRNGCFWDRWRHTCGIMYGLTRIPIFVTSEAIRQWFSRVMKLPHEWQKSVFTHTLFYFLHAILRDTGIVTSYSSNGVCTRKLAQMYGGVEGPPHIFFRHHAISYGWHSNSSVGDSNYCYVIRRTY